MTRREMPALVRAFEGHTLPKAQWTHAAHLTVGLWYVMTEPLLVALQRMREGVRTYNEACGVRNTEASGYHETITRVFLIGIAAHVLESPTRDFDELLQSLLSGPCADSRFPLRYFTKERLMSPAARADWIEPDLEPLVGPSL